MPEYRDEEAVSTTRSEGRVPKTLPGRPCEDRDLFRAYVGEAEMYRGHNGGCDNCDAEYHESDDGDLSTAHWMHTKAGAMAFWHRDTPSDVKRLCLLMDPDDPMDATEHATSLWKAQNAMVGGLDALVFDDQNESG